jgi:hypothetical protein
MHPLADGHPFLRELKANHDPRFDELARKIEACQLNHAEFHGRFHAWLRNFKKPDYALALRVFLELDYYPDPRFETELRFQLEALKREGIYLTGVKQNARLVLPDNVVDSAFRHAWLTSKIEGLDGKAVWELKDLNADNTQNLALVFINDTHGSGNQFIREVWGPLAKLGISPKQIIVVGIAIAYEAMERFQAEGFQIFPEDTAKSALAVFSGNDLARLEELGAALYPKHPLGYGDNALLVAYQFQCPNNTLPIIWASGSADYPWKPLFPYRGKTSTEKAGPETNNPYQPKPKAREPLEKPSGSPGVNLHIGRDNHGDINLGTQIKTQGGAVILGDVKVINGDFVGRDKKG